MILAGELSGGGRVIVELVQITILWDLLRRFDSYES
jgi:hypothetical protein